jgi:PAS domain-containing protein
MAGRVSEPRPEGEVMTGQQIDYAAVYRQLPMPVLLLTPEFAIADVNQASLHATGRARDELLGRDVFDAFPSNPSDPGATTVHSTIASLRRVLDTGEPSAMELQKSDVEVPGSPGQFTRYYWSGINAPVLGPDGRVELIAIMAEDVTDRLHRFMSALETEAASQGIGGSDGQADTF